MKYNCEEHRIEDVLQDVYIAALELQKTRPNHENLQAWLLAVCRNNCVNFVRHLISDVTRNKGYLHSHTAEGVGMVTVAPVSRDLEYQEELVALKRAIEKLPPRQQEVIRLYYFEQMKLVDIAVAMNIEAGTVGSYHFRALQKLKCVMSGTSDPDTPSSGGAS